MFTDAKECTATRPRLGTIIPGTAAPRYVMHSAAIDQTVAVQGIRDLSYSPPVLHTGEPYVSLFTAIHHTPSNAATPLKGQPN